MKRSHVTTMVALLLVASVAAIALVFTTSGVDGVDHGRARSTPASAKSETHAPLDPVRDLDHAVRAIGDTGREAPEFTEAPAIGVVAVFGVSGFANERAKVRVWCTDDAPSNVTDAGGDVLPVWRRTDVGFQFQLPAAATHFIVEATSEVCIPRRVIATRAELIAGVRITLRYVGWILLEGRLVDPAHVPLSREQLLTLFGADLHRQSCGSLRAMRDDWQAWEHATRLCVDFDTAAFAAEVKPGFAGAVILREGERRASSTRWKDGDAPIDLVVDCAALAASRAMLTVRLNEVPADEAIDWTLWFRVPTPDDEWVALPARLDPLTTGQGFHVEGLAAGTYRVRCARYADDDRVICRWQGFVAAGARVEVALDAIDEVNVRLAVQVDGALPADHWAQSRAGARYDDPYETTLFDATQAISRDVQFRIVPAAGWPALEGRLPVGTWWLVIDRIPQCIEVRPDGSCNPPYVSARPTIDARFRVSPLPQLSGEGQRTGVRFCTFSKEGIPLDSCTYSGWPQEGDSAVFEVVLPQGSATVEITTRAFAKPTRVDLDLRESPNEPILVEVP